MFRHLLRGLASPTSILALTITACSSGQPVTPSVEISNASHPTAPLTPPFASVQTPLSSPRPESLTSGDLARKAIQETTEGGIAEAQNCYQWSYQHTDTEDHTRSAENCSVHGNRFRIPHDLQEIHKKSICVRMNGIPVEHEMQPKSGSIETGPVPSIRTQISIRYCLKPEKKPDPCQIPRDELDAQLEGGPDENLWDTSGTTEKMSDSLRKALDRLDEEGVSEAWTRNESLDDAQKIQMARIKK